MSEGEDSKVAAVQQEPVVPRRPAAMPTNQSINRLRQKMTIASAGDFSRHDPQSLCPGQSRSVGSIGCVHLEASDVFDDMDVPKQSRARRPNGSVYSHPMEMNIDSSFDSMEHQTNGDGNMASVNLGKSDVSDDEVVPKRSPGIPPNLPVNSLRKKLGIASLGVLSESQVPSTSCSEGSVSMLNSENLEQSEEEADDVSESDSECLEEYSDSEEGEDDANANSLDMLELHPIHMAEVSDDALLKVEPASMPGCKTAFQLARALAAFAGRQRSLAACCCFLHGRLFVAGGKFSVLVTLLGAQLVTVPAQGSRRGQLSVISIIPKDQQKQNCGEEDAPDIRAWTFYCPTRYVHNVMNTLGEKGCYLSGLSDFYAVDYCKFMGAGGFGWVVRGSQKGGRDPVAVKMLKETVSQSVVDKEVEMLVLAQGHANIVRFRGCFCEQSDTEQPQMCIVLDFYEKGDLFNHVSSPLQRRMTEQDAIPWMNHLLSALCYLGDRDILHRDVKPENLLLAKHGKVVLADFGIACVISDTEEMQKPRGSMSYASPEMFSGRAKGTASDAVSAGVVLYFILSETTPFWAHSTEKMVAKTLECKVRLKRQCFDDISEECRSLLLGLISKDPSTRMSCRQALSITAAFRCLQAATAPDLDATPSQAPMAGTSDVASLALGALPALKRVRIPINGDGSTA